MSNESDQVRDGSVSKNDPSAAEPNLSWEERYKQLLAQNDELRLQLEEVTAERNDYLVQLMDFLADEIPELADKKGGRRPKICEQSIEEIIAEIEREFPVQS